MKKISVLVPCYNESENVNALYDAVSHEIDTLDRYTWEIVFEDNGSTDNTVELLRALSEKDERVRVIVNQSNYGVERSSSNLILSVCADAIITIAADLQDPPSLIPQFVEAWEKGWLVVLGKYNSRKENFILRGCRSLYYKVVDAFSDISIENNVTGFGLYDMSVINELRRLGEYCLVTRFICSELGYPIKYLPYKKPQRVGGRSSYSFIKYYRTAVDSLVLTSHVPLHLASFIGFLISVLSLFVALYYFIYKLVNWYTFELGLAPLTIGLFFLGGVQLFFIGVLCEYLSSVIKRQQKRPYVIEKERINFENYDEPGFPKHTEDL